MFPRAGSRTPHPMLPCSRKTNCNAPAPAGQHTDEVLGEWGFSAAEIASLHDAKAIV